MAADALAYKVARLQDELRSARGHAGRPRALQKLLTELADLGFDRLPGVRKRPVIAQLADLLEVRIEDIEQAMPRGRPAPARVASEPNHHNEHSGHNDAAAAAAAADLWTEEAHVPPARRLAERELLAVLIYQPSLRRQPLGGDPVAAVPAASMLSPEGFADPVLRRLAETVWTWLGRDASFTVQELMAGLDEPRLRGLAAELYIEAEQRLEAGEESPAEFLRDRFQALQRLAERELYRRDLDAYRRTRESSGEGAIEKLLEQRRKQGYIPYALPTRVRS